MVKPVKSTKEKQQPRRNGSSNDEGQKVEGPYNFRIEDDPEMERALRRMGMSPEALYQAQSWLNKYVADWDAEHEQQQQQQQQATSSSSSSLSKSLSGENHHRRR